MAFRAESIGMPISDFELRISDLTVSFSIRIPQSTIRNSGGPPFFLTPAYRSVYKNIAPGGKEGLEG